MALPGMEAPVLAPAAEWPCAVSAKFANIHTGKPAGRRIVDTGCRDGPDHSIAQRGLGSYFADTAGLVSQQGKRCFLQPDSAVSEWKPSRRSLSEPGCEHYERPEGRRNVEQRFRKVVSLREKRHIRQASSKEEFCDRPNGIQTIVRPNGLRAHDQPAREVDLSAELQRKSRPLDLMSQRNGVGCASLGDKSYRHPEYDQGFHHAGGLVVGSTFMRGTNKKSQPRSSANVQIVLSEGTVKSYAETQRKNKKAELEKEVEALTRTWEASTLKECDAGYEPVSDSDEEGVPQAA